MITKNDLQSVFEIHRILARGEDFMYLLPHPTLQKLISNYTITFPGKGMISEGYTVIPHGSATLVFGYNGNELYGSLFGPATKPCVVGRQANQAQMLMIIEFQPAGLFSFTGIGQRELAGRCIPFELIQPLLNRLLAETLFNACNVNQLITGIDQVLLARSHGDSPGEIQASARLIIEAAGNISLKELSGSVYYSERHLNRIFNEYLGMSVKSFSRLVRINKTLRLLRDPGNSITFACEYTGFYDLSHFIHDFKAVCGITPQDYRSNMSDFYSEIAKF